MSSCEKITRCNFKWKARLKNMHCKLLCVLAKTKTCKQKTEYKSMLLKPGKRKAIRWELLTSEVSSERFIPITEMRLQQLREPASLTGPQRGQTGRDDARVTSEEVRLAPGSQRSRTTWAEYPLPRTGEPLTTWTRVDLRGGGDVNFSCQIWEWKRPAAHRKLKTHTSCLGIRCIFVWKIKILEAQARPPEVAQRRVRVSHEPLRGELKQGVERSPS